MFKPKCKVGDLVRLVTTGFAKELGWVSDEGRIVYVCGFDDDGDISFAYKEDVTKTEAGYKINDEVIFSYSDQANGFDYEVLEKQEEEETKEYSGTGLVLVLQSVYSFLEEDEPSEIQRYIEGALDAIGESVN